ncbi:hypothetical protein [Undibacterium seohonense]|nr:hypothetical protein [Undibacterium seohonense]
MQSTRSNIVTSFLRLSAQNPQQVAKFAVAEWKGEWVSASDGK